MHKYRALHASERVCLCPPSTVTDNKRFVKFMGVLCDLLLAPVQDGGWAGRACCGRVNLPVVGRAALYRAGSRSAVRTDAV